MPDKDLVLKSLSGSAVTIFFQDVEGVFRWFVNPQSLWATGDLTGQKEDVVLGSEALKKLQEAKRTVLASGERGAVELAVTPPNDTGDPRPFYIKLTIEPAFDAKRDVEGFVCSSIDISEQLKREQTLKNLLREVAHRSKNMLAMVLSLSGQTARVASTKDEFVRRFTGRLQSLAKSQDVITERDWHGSAFSDLVKRQVIDVVPFQDGHIEVTGEDPELGPNGTLHVGLALHELVTNALVHGSLTRPGGRVEINCEDLGDYGFRLTWTESPRVISSAPKAKSFGRTMLERIVPSAVNGQGTLDITDDAVIYSLDIGRTEIV
ncbi:sensor histidine kinase [Oricola cellulosilytica]|nr:HWE histidine kinase domain-containing protein [Oricola cellulosilytica]